MDMTQPRYGVLLVNLGTPCKPTPHCVKCFLSQFLADERVVDLPRWQWMPILHGIILNTRPKRVAKAYQSIWREEGSPLKYYSLKQQKALAELLEQRLGERIPVELGMTYCKPGMSEGLEKLEAAGVDKVVVLPLFPQYSCSTTGAVVDALAATLKQKRSMPEYRLIRDYHNDASYIKALAATVRESWAEQGRSQKLLISFHGVPQRYVDEGDLYRDHCEATAKGLADELGLAPDEYLVCFQSRFGKEPWLQPYFDETLEALPGQGVKSVDVISPAFSVDCLETLEELAIEGKSEFLEAGGEEYRFVPCLNDRPDHIAMMADLVEHHAGNWGQQVADKAEQGAA
ncbi:ferrochelatase [Ferrimonas marina]|uniref:Ferrochelatase n=1 Tax=Ferrimonas marina TaxID=299255 RepID=A0A1M5RKP4_9GAMM|nr:ferrochelatase [Ferrimonas marina]SHH26781.1 ferrochelatase [Ferrimonas marina]